MLKERKSMAAKRIKGRRNASIDTPNTLSFLYGQDASTKRDGVLVCLHVVTIDNSLRFWCQMMQGRNHRTGYRLSTNKHVARPLESRVLSPSV